MHASKYAELMHIRLSLRLSLVSYLCRYFTLLRFYHSTAFILCILHYLSRQKRLTYQNEIIYCYFILLFLDIYRRQSLRIAASSD